MESEDYIRHHKLKEGRMKAWDMEAVEIELEKVRQANAMLLTKLHEMQTNEVALLAHAEEQRDLANSLFVELEAAKVRCYQLEGTVGRLRLHIQQGVEL